MIEVFLCVIIDIVYYGLIAVVIDGDGDGCGADMFIVSFSCIMLYLADVVCHVGILERGKVGVMT